MSESPLRQQIAEAIHAPHCFFNEEPGHCQPGLNDYDAADAVVALLNLRQDREVFGSGPYVRLVGPWLPSTPPDTNSSEPA